MKFAAWVLMQIQSVFTSSQETLCFRHSALCEAELRVASSTRWVRSLPLLLHCRLGTAVGWIGFP